MTSDELIEKIHLARTADELDVLQQHDSFSGKACSEAIEEARLLVGPLAEWSGETFQEVPPASLATRVANELAGTVRPAANQTRVRSTVRQWASAALIVAVAAGLFFRKSPLVVGTGTTSSPQLITDADESGRVDPQAVAYVEQTEQWLLSTVSAPTGVDLRFEVSFEEPANWFATNVLPVAESLKRAGQQSTLSPDDQPAS